MKMRTLASAALALALAACGFGGGVSSLPGSSGDNTPAAQNAFGPLATATLNVSIVIPGTKTVADYISPGTQSLVIVEGTKTVGTFNTSRSSKGCKRSGANTACKFSVAVQTGKQIFTFRTYSKKNGGGAVLASSRLVKKISSGTNNISLSLKGITQSIVVGLSEPSPLIGNAVVIDVIVTALDASGAVITGKYSSTVKLSDADKSGATSLSGTKVTSSSSKLTLSYNGSAYLTSAVINAKASGVKNSNIFPATLRPTTKAGLTVSGTAALSVISDGSGNVAAYIPVNGSTSTSKGGVITVALAKNGKIVNAVRAPHSVRPSLTLSPSPDECAPDIEHAQIYCMSFYSNIVSILSYNPANVLAGLTLVGQTTVADAVNGVSFSGATCKICGIAFDPTDNAYIVSTANGYEFWPTAPGATTPLKILPAPISENFGYNALTNQIFSPWYGTDSFSTSGLYAGLDLIDVTTGYRYLLQDTATGFYVSSPDAGAVDTKTNIAFAPEESSVPVYLDNLNAPPAVYTAPTPLPTPTTGPPPYPVGSYSNTVASINPGSTLITLCDETYTAADSVKDYAFFGSEYCGQDYIAVGQLPTTSSGTLTFSNYVAAELPNTPNGYGFESPLDPHAVIVANIPGICDDCGILFNYDKSYVAIVDLNALLALNPSGGELDVPTSSKLKGIVTYVATGVTSPPGYFARKLAQAHWMHRHHKQRHYLHS
jgi:hypothetical protein